MTSKAEDVDKIMEYLIRGEDAPSYLADEGICWPGSDELLDNLFSLEDPSLGLLDQPLPYFSLDASPEGLVDGDFDGDLGELGPYPDIAGSSCSDSGLSSDHTDLTDYDQQLSPFLIQNTCSGTSSPPLHSPQHITDAPASPLFSGDFEGSPQHVPSPTDTPPNLSEPTETTQFDTDGPGSPQGTVEVETTSPAAPVVKQTQKIIFTDTFQNQQNRKRCLPVTPNVKIVQPKVHKTITNAPVTVTSKPHVFVTGKQQKPVRVTNIQFINPQPRVFCKPNDNIGHRKVIRVAPMAGNPRSILLPVTIKDMKDLRGIKIINASDLKNASNIKFTTANLLSQSKVQEIKTENISLADMDYDSNHTGGDDSMSDGSDEDDWRSIPRVHVPNKNNHYPRLTLTAEERKLLSKEGIKLPTSYPLTKHEERELKRIRRKIRNKISAQDSRKRKKEYVDGLEDRVKQCSEENQTLMKRLKIMQSQNQSLVAQLKRYQSLMSGGGRSAQPATCLLVLLLSVALVALPSLREAERAPAHTGPHALRPTAEEAPHHALRRALLSASHKTASEEMVVDDGEFIMEDIITFKPHSDHDYQVMKTEPRGRPAPPGYRDMYDEDWPPSRKHRIKFDYDDGPDYLPLIKDENYENSHANPKPDYALHMDSGGQQFMLMDSSGKLSELRMVAVKNEDILTEEVNIFERNGTAPVRSMVVNRTLAN